MEAHTFKQFTFSFIYHYYFFLDDGCVSLSDGDQSFSGNIKYLEMKWYETPSVVKFAGGKFYARFSRTHGHDIFKPRQLRVE